MKFALRGQTRTFRVAFTDRNGDPKDPTDITGEVYDPESTLKHSFVLGDFTKISTGIYEVAYTPASDAIIGRWKLIVDGKDGTEPIGKDTIVFKVTAWYVPEISEVRQTLNNLSDSQVGDLTVASKINLAYTIVLENISGAAKQSLKEEATLAWACFLVYKEYVAKLERGPGVTPAATVMLESYKEEAMQFLEFVKKGAPAYEPSIDQPDTLLRQYLDGELAEDEDFY